MKTQLAAKEAATAELEKLADAAAHLAQQVAALRSELALKTQQLAEQQRLLAQHCDKVRRNSQSQCPRHLCVAQSRGAPPARTELQCRAAQDRLVLGLSLLSP